MVNLALMNDNDCETISQSHSSFPCFLQGWITRNAMPGRLVCDTRVSAHELVRSRTYTLSDLANQILPSPVTGDNNDKAAPTLPRQVPSVILDRLGCPKDAMLGAVELADLEIDSADLRCLFVSSDAVRQLIDFCLSDAHLSLRLTQQLQVSKCVYAVEMVMMLPFVASCVLSGSGVARGEAMNFRLAGVHDAGSSAWGGGEVLHSNTYVLHILLHPHATRSFRSPCKSRASAGTC